MYFHFSTILLHFEHLLVRESRENSCPRRHELITDTRSSFCAAFVIHDTLYGQTKWLRNAEITHIRNVHYIVRLLLRINLKLDMRQQFDDGRDPGVQHTHRLARGWYARSIKPKRNANKTRTSTTRIKQTNHAEYKRDAFLLSLIWEVEIRWRPYGNTNVNESYQLTRCARPQSCTSPHSSEVSPIVIVIHLSFVNLTQRI